ncbi:MAG: hypothetical protein RIR57_686 [Bacteroidota bacterium]|jgi:hypothetical protein
MKNAHYLYLILSIVGGGFTFYFVFEGMMENKGTFDVISFVQSTWTTNPYAKSLSCDFWTGAIAGTLFILLEGMRIKIKNLYLYLLATVLIGFAFAFPLFLFFRHQKLAKN